MHTKTRSAGFAGTKVLALLLLWGCQTVSDQAPPELHTAQNALREARTEDVSSMMPSAYEGAKRKFYRSIELFDESTNYQKAGEEAQAKATLEQAVKTAEESTAIARNGTNIVKEMRAYDTNSGGYISMAEQAKKAAALAAENQALKGQNAKLVTDNAAEVGSKADLERQNKELASRPAAEKIPDSFKIAKPVAYFGSGSTRLEARYQSEIQDLARILTVNKDLSVKLEGFADPRGSVELNQKLAKQRIDAVKQELTAQGVDASRIQENVFGKTADEVQGASRGALQLDRKVTATVFVVAH